MDTPQDILLIPVSEKNNALETQRTAVLKSLGKYNPGKEFLDKPRTEQLSEDFLRHYAQQKQPNFREHRERFINYLFNNLKINTKGESRGTNNFPKYLTGDLDIRKENPTAASITAKKFLGEQGLILYLRALEEEFISPEYRLAVFSRATVHIPGNTLSKRPVILIGGPSGSGKSSVALTFLRMVCDYLPTQEHNLDGNKFVFLDGGIVRIVSQMRKLLIRACIFQGFTGISDLHELSEELENEMKDLLEMISLNNTNPRFGIIKPETFSYHWIPFSDYLLSHVLDDKNTDLIFSCIKGIKGREEDFKNAVKFMGENRAFRREFKQVKTKQDFYELVETLDLNETKNLPESKKYNERGFYFGEKGTAKAFKDYKSLMGKKSLYFKIKNDLMLLKEVSPGEWVSAEPHDKNIFMVPFKVFANWLENKDKSGKSLQEFYAESETTLDITASRRRPAKLPQSMKPESSAEVPLPNKSVEVPQSEIDHIEETPTKHVGRRSPSQFAQPESFFGPSKQEQEPENIKERFKKAKEPQKSSPKHEQEAERKKSEEPKEPEDNSTFRP